MRVISSILVQRAMGVEELKFRVEFFPQSLGSLIQFCNLLLGKCEFFVQPQASIFL